jgi:hypothetical protein
MGGTPATLVEKMTAYRKLYAEILDLVAELNTERVAEQAGYPSLPAFLNHLLHLNTPDASRMVAHAEQITETLTPTGHLRPAPLPTVRQALHKGELDPRHIDAVTDTMARLPEWATLEHRELVETTLAETARTENRGWRANTAESCWTASTRTAPNPPTTRNPPRRATSSATGANPVVA